MELPHIIRHHRIRLDLTLEELAAKTGVSRAMLSDIERGVKNPTIKVVCQIAEGLGCSVSQLVGEPDPPIPIQVIRQPERQTLEDPLTGIRRQLLSPLLVGHGIEVVWYEIPTGQQTEAFPAHRRGVIEHITVIEGQLEGVIEGQTVRLDPGDSVVFPAQGEHRFRNVGSGICSYFLVIDSTQVGR